MVLGGASPSRLLSSGQQSTPGLGSDSLLMKQPSPGMLFGDRSDDVDLVSELRLGVQDGRLVSLDGAKGAMSPMQGMF